AFVHARIADHLIGVHAASHTDLLSRVIRERFWEHDTKYLVHDAGMAAPQLPLLPMVRAAARDRGPALDRAVELEAVVAIVSQDLGAEEQTAIEDRAFRVCAARPVFAHRHLGQWATYWSRAQSLMVRSGIEQAYPRGGEDLPALIERAVEAEGL